MAGRRRAGRRRLLGGGAVIFASVGSMLPFERFVRAIDDWAAANRNERVFLQIGETEFEPKHAEWCRILPPADYRRALEECRFFVAHVGMGSILQGIEARKPMILLVRKPELGEHTQDHQRATAAKFIGKRGIRITEDESELLSIMDSMTANRAEVPDSVSTEASPELITNVREFLRRSISRTRPTHR